LAELVTTTTYVPVVETVGFCCVELNPPGPLQLKLVPEVVDACSETLEFTSVIAPPVAVAPGGVVFWFTTAWALLVQPSFEFVTVTMYVPDSLTVGFCCVELNPPGPLQAKLVPCVVADCNATLVVVQVSVPPVALAPGGFVVWSTIAVAVFVQPFTSFVARKVYVPETVTVGFCAVELNPPGPFHRKAVPEVVEPLSWILVVVQVSVPPDAVAPGSIVFWSTDAVAVLVQPLAEFVTSKLYVPETLTVGFCTSEVYPPGPLQR
jgi:hypothetical protein